MKINLTLQNIQNTNNRRAKVNFTSSKFYNEKICLQKSHICNFKQWDEKLYSGSQPGKRGDFKDIYFLDTGSLKNDIDALKKLGICKIIDLRIEAIDGICVPAEKQIAKKAAIEYKNIPMFAHHIPTNEQIKTLFKELKTAQGPVFLHCKEGYDRTGMMLCVYLAHTARENPYKTIKKVFDERNLTPFRFLNAAEKQKMSALISYISGLNQKDFELFLKNG